MKAHYTLFVVLLSFWYSVELNAGQVPYIFRHIGVTDGLPDNYVKIKEIFGVTPTPICRDAFRGRKVRK